MNEGALIRGQKTGDVSGEPQVVFIDGIVRSGGGTFIDNAVGMSTYLRHVYITGTNDIIQSGSESTVTAAGTWKRVNEYAYTDQQSINASSRIYPCESLIDGSKSSTAEPATDIDASVDAPTTDYIDRHIIEQPRIDDGPYVDIVVDHSATEGPSIEQGEIYAGGNDDTADSLAAIHAAIAAASSAGHNRVFVPRGIFYITDTIVLLADTIFFGTGYGTSIIAPRSNWQPTSQVYMLRSADDAAGTASLTNIMLHTRIQGGTGDGITAPRQYDWFSWVHWRTGGDSVVAGPIAHNQFAGKGAVLCQPKQYFTLTGNGGGRWYAITPQFKPSGHADCRIWQITGTSEPLQIYGANLELGKNASSGNECDYQMEVQSASNIRVYGDKREGYGDSTYINDSSNIGIFGFGRQSLNRANDVHGIYGTSDDIVIGLSLCDGTDKSIGSDGMVAEDLDTEDAVQINHATGCSIYRRGTPDDSAMYT